MHNIIKVYVYVRQSTEICDVIPKTETNMTAQDLFILFVHFHTGLYQTRDDQSFQWLTGDSLGQKRKGKARVK